ncbi:Hemin receptor [Moritella viscosa]|uniref:TonB-dependent hemoglobin/transferrin/lactoferrin family receptor n=1 Tax=Moritella viscosa TaxID=80854 RepID=UPI00090F4613|nr:TonB-dependent hemoglobin/transferrin/lactoferrin family receptor [Moritella viscosa]SHO19968.1 Hemin receptor [Moritella viscosa]
MKFSILSTAVLSVLINNAALANSESTPYGETIVTANIIEQPLSKVAGSISVLGGDEIEKKGVTELYDALNNEPGVSVSGGAGRPQSITIRGMSGNRIAITKDGIKTSDGYGALDLNDKVGMNSFDLSNVKSIEVVKGASSSIHGSGAIGGAVIITTKDASDYLKYDDLYLDVSGTYTGISNKYKVASNLAFRTGDTESLINMAYWVGEETRNFNQDLYNRDVDGYSMAYSVNHFMNESVMFNAKVDYFTDNLSRLEGIASTQKDGIMKIASFNEQTTTDGFGVNVGMVITPYDSWFDEMDTKIYWRKTENNSNTNRLMKRKHNGIEERRREIKKQLFNDELIGIGSDFVSTLDSGSLNHQVAYGLSMTVNSYERLKNKTTLDWNGHKVEADKPFAPAASYNVGAYIRDVIEIDDWTITGGARFDMHRLTPDSGSDIGGFPVKDIDNSEFSPSLSLAYQFTDELTTYLSYNHGYRAPSYDKAYGYVSHDFIPLTPFVIIPNMDLEAETSDSFELGSKYDNGRTKIYGAIFYQKFQNFIDVKQIGYDSSTGNYLKQYQNVDGVETYGMELSVAHRLDENWSTGFKAGYVDGKDKDGDYVRSITPWEGNVQLTYELEKLTVYSVFDWADSMNRIPSCATDIGLKTDCATTSGWGVVDMGASYYFSSGLEISANVVNLFDRKHIRYQGVAGISSNATKYSTEPGRYFTLNAKYIF